MKPLMDFAIRHNASIKSRRKAASFNKPAARERRDCVSISVNPLRRGVGELCRSTEMSWTVIANGSKHISDVVTL